MLNTREIVFFCNLLMSDKMEGDSKKVKKNSMVDCARQTLNCERKMNAAD